MTWAPIDTLKHQLPVIRPHYCWGPMVVLRGRQHDGVVRFEWVTADHSNSYPEESFLPFWMPVPSMPPGEALVQRELPPAEAIDALQRAFDKKAQEIR